MILTRSERWVWETWRFVSSSSREVLLINWCSL